MQVRVTEGGRIVIPADIRKQAGIEVGETVNIEVDADDSVRISSRKLALRRAQQEFRKRVPAGRSLADELIAERRREAANE
jgi:AbrB family looped-hinge helix DNA binding protein